MLLQIPFRAAAPFLLACSLTLSASGQAATSLWAAGYAVIPTPQRVQLSTGEIAIDENWSIDARGVSENDIAARTLIGELSSSHGIRLKSSVEGKKKIRLEVRRDSVQTGAGPAIQRQAYRLTIAENEVEIVGSAGSGLFYGVQTLLQLLKRNPDGKLVAPLGRIEDWPTMELRFLHWDTKHHQSRMETLKQYLDWAARFKANMIGFELEDKFEYPSHPSIGAPGAFTTKQLQELTDYALERYIQIVPQVQAPAHFSYVLKHPEFADLRADGSNYMICTCDRRAYDLIFAMYDDVIRATKGVDYFFVSTDEVYYAGLCDRCSRAYNPVNRSLEFVDFVNKAHEFLAKRGRKMLIWAEFPLLPEHVKLLPPGIIDGEGTFVPEEKERGIRQLAYEAMQGAELLFPDHLTMDPDHKGRLETAFEEIAGGRHWKGDPAGTYAAAWDDSGLHSETFWLGWSAVARWGWHPGTPEVDQHVAEFARVYYGPRVNGIALMYRLLQGQARAWEQSWDRVPSRVIPTRYGGYFGKGLSTHRTDITLTPPLINDLPDWFPDPPWSDRYKLWIAEARARSAENRQLIDIIQTNIGLADRNQYNLEVFLALARFMEHHWRLFLDLERAETQIRTAQGVALSGTAKDAIAGLTAAYDTVDRLRQDGDSVFLELRRVFEKSRYPKGESAGGRQFVHVFDDVKDHFADRRPDLSYMRAPEDSIGLDGWLQEFDSIIRLYGTYSGVQVPSR